MGVTARPFEPALMESGFSEQQSYALTSASPRHGEPDTPKELASPEGVDVEFQQAGYRASTRSSTGASRSPPSARTESTPREVSPWFFEQAVSNLEPLTACGTTSPFDSASMPVSNTFPYQGS